MALVDSTEVSLLPSSYELRPSDLDTGANLSATPRCLPSLPSMKIALGDPPRLASPPPIPSVNIYSVIVAVASGDPTQYLDGVEGDLAFVFNELDARATDSVRVITDVKDWDNRAQAPTLESVKASIEAVGQSLKLDDLCYIYIGGHIEMNPDGTSYMPLPNGEHLRGDVLASWLKAAAAGGGIITAIVDVCHSSAFL
ncbi:hypothetical protein FRC01_003891, partial [Tulasnella sp. 417]